MKEKPEKTKVVVRNLPPTIAESSFLEVLDKILESRYSWCRFCQGKSRPSHPVYSRAYVSLKNHEDVLALYDNIDGRIFINERGVQYKAIVEYAPFQRIPKVRTKKDTREGTIHKDVDYLAFVESLEKTEEMLPSAEIQLERREAEKAAALVVTGGKEPVIVTPLMEFLRNKRAAKSAPTARILTARQSKGSAAGGNAGKKERFRADTDKDRGASGEKRRKEPVTEGKERRGGRDSSSSATNFKSTVTAAHLRADEDTAQATTADLVARGGGCAAVPVQVPVPLPTRLAIPSGVHSGDGAPPSGIQDKNGRREGSKRARQREREREKEGNAMAMLASAADAQPPAKSGARRQSPHAARGPQRLPSGHNNNKGSDVTTPRSQPNAHHDAVPIAPSTQQPAASTNEGSNESRRLRNKDRPDRPVWTPRRRGDSAPATTSSGAPPSVAAAGPKPAGAALPLPPAAAAASVEAGSMTSLRRDARTVGALAAAPVREDGVVVVAEEESLARPCSGLESGVQGAGGGHGPAVPPARGRGGKKGSQHARTNVAAADVGASGCAADASQAGIQPVKSNVVPSGKRGGRGGRVMRNPGDSANLSERDGGGGGRGGGGGGRKSEGSKQGGRSNLNATPKDGGQRGNVGPPNGHNGMPPS